MKRVRISTALSVMLAAACFFADVAVAKDAAPAKKYDGKSGLVSADSTQIDFTETMIDGKMQAPQGFFLQGRQSQSMTQMVRLRSKFRSELRNSKSAVKALVK
jgi:hypothetical protein